MSELEAIRSTLPLGDAPITSAMFVGVVQDLTKAVDEGEDSGDKMIFPLSVHHKVDVGSVLLCGHFRLFP